MASDYSRTCVSPDSIQTGEAPVVSETCEVYVWGSNSSHQLVEGTQEKILQPKLAATFADAQTVRASLFFHELSPGSKNAESSRMVPGLRNLLVPGSQSQSAASLCSDLRCGVIFTTAGWAWF